MLCLSRYGNNIVGCFASKAERWMDGRRSADINTSGNNISEIIPADSSNEKIYRIALTVGVNPDKNSAG